MWGRSQVQNQMLLPLCRHSTFSDNLTFHHTPLRTKSVSMVAKPMLEICNAAVPLPKTLMPATSPGKKQPQRISRGIPSRASHAPGCPIWTMARPSSKGRGAFSPAGTGEASARGRMISTIFLISLQVDKRPIPLHSRRLRPISLPQRHDE